MIRRYEVRDDLGVIFGRYFTHRKAVRVRDDLNRDDPNTYYYGDDWPTYEVHDRRQP